MTSLLNAKDIENHYLAMMELDEDPRICGERFIRTFSAGVHSRTAALAVLDVIVDNRRPDHGTT